MDHRFYRLLAVILSAVALAACEGTFGTKEEEMEAEQAETGDAATRGADEEAGGATSALGEGTGFQGHPLDDPASALSTRTIYFDFDKSDIKAEARPVVEAHAQYLASNGSASITLEGHADERGSREYNIALGERRANAVRQLMTLLGSSGQQIRVVSYGEERPAAMGHDESAWSLNRRVEIIYRTR